MSSITTKKGARAPSNKNPNSTKTRKNRRRRLRQRNNRKASNQVIERSVVIQKCTAEYASALVNPFGPINTLPCIPDYLSIPSFKFQAKSRGVFSTGTMGVGFVAFNPWLMANGTGSNEPLGTTTSFPILYTDVTYSQNDYDGRVTAGNLQAGVNGANSNSPFNANFWSNGDRQLRLVAAGIRISYTGSNFRNQGRVILYKNSGNTFVDDGSVSSDFLNDSMTSIVSISRKSEYVFYTPDSHILLGYQNFATYDPNDGGGSRRSLLIYIDGGDITDPQSWLFEAISYFEAVGPNFTLSKSHSDPEGFGDVIDSLPLKNPITVPKAVEMSVMRKMFNQIKERLVGYGPELLRLGTNAALNAAFGGSNVGLTLPSIMDVD